MEAEERDETDKYQQDEEGIDLYGLDPVSTSPAKCFISSLFSCPILDGSDGILSLHGHAITLVELVGTVTGIVSYYDKTIISVDDSTGIMPCCHWISDHSFHSRFNNDSLDVIISNEVKLGDLVRVRGKIRLRPTLKDAPGSNMKINLDSDLNSKSVMDGSSINGAKRKKRSGKKDEEADSFSEHSFRMELKVYAIKIECDPNIELVHWLDVMVLEEEVYKKKFETEERIVKVLKGSLPFKELLAYFLGILHLGNGDANRIEANPSHSSHEGEEIAGSKKEQYMESPFQAKPSVKPHHSNVENVCSIIDMSFPPPSSSLYANGGGSHRYKLRALPLLPFNVNIILQNPSIHQVLSSRRRHHHQQHANHEFKPESSSQSSSLAKNEKSKQNIASYGPTSTPPSVLPIPIPSSSPFPSSPISSSSSSSRALENEIKSSLDALISSGYVIHDPLGSSITLAKRSIIENHLEHLFPITLDAEEVKKIRSSLKSPHDTRESHQTSGKPSPSNNKNTTNKKNPSQATSHAQQPSDSPSKFAPSTNPRLSSFVALSSKHQVGIGLPPSYLRGNAYHPSKECPFMVVTLDLLIPCLFSFIVEDWHSRQRQCEEDVSEGRKTSYRDHQDQDQDQKGRGNFGSNKQSFLYGIKAANCTDRFKKSPPYKSVYDKMPLTVVQKALDAMVDMNILFQTGDTEYKLSHLYIPSQSSS